MNAGSASAESVAALLEEWTFSVGTEALLQTAIEGVLRTADVDAQREVSLTAGDRIDFLVGRVGIEVKVKGSGAVVLRQLQRYAHSPLVDELLLVTTCPTHLGFPDTIAGVPLRTHLVQSVGGL